MKFLSVLILVCVLSLPAPAQNAADYFPHSLGSSWKYQRFTLDSLQQQITASKLIEVDTLTQFQQIKGSAAYVLIGKGLPRPETTLVNIGESTISLFVVGYPRVTDILPIDSLGLGFVWNYRNWYPFMKFGSPSTSGVVDTLLRIDTAVSFSSTLLPLTIVVSAQRMANTTVTVPAGNLAATPFNITLSVVTPRNMPGVGRVEYPLVSLADTMFISSNKWIVKEIQPSTYFPLSNPGGYNVAITNIPGFVRVLESLTLTEVGPGSTVANGFSLEQNYPNPFNPATTVKFSIPDFRFVSLKIFDVMGREVRTLVSEPLAGGSHTISFDASAFSSGTYFYRLTARELIETRKMILEK